MNLRWFAHIQDVWAFFVVVWPDMMWCQPSLFISLGEIAQYVQFGLALKVLIGIHPS